MAEGKNRENRQRINNRGIRDGGKGPCRLAAKKWGLINYSSGKIGTPGLLNPRIEDFPRKDLDSEGPLQR